MENYWNVAIKVKKGQEKYSSKLKDWKESGKSRKLKVAKSINAREKFVTSNCLVT